MNSFKHLFPLFLLFGLLVACTTAAPTPTPVPTIPLPTPTPTTPPTPVIPPVRTAVVTSNDTYTIPLAEPGKFNVAFVYYDPLGALGGWTYAHEQGRLYVESELENVHTAYVENVSRDEDGERIIEQLAANGFQAIFTTSFGFMEATELAAAKFPDTYFVHISGFRKNDTNFANLFGAMESMQYLAGMIAGAKAQEQGGNRIGYVATFPLPEVIRHVNAAAIGMRETCPECLMDVRWTFSWFDPEVEKIATEEMLADGAMVILGSTDSTTPLEVAAAAGRFSIGYDSDVACDVAPDFCLASSYWVWGKPYADLVAQMQAGTFKPDNYYFDVESGGLGLLGFMEGQTPSENIPADVVTLIQAKLALMQAGEFDRFDIFKGPLLDNEGNTLILDESPLTQSDLEGLHDEVAFELGRPGCEICMFWLVEGIIGDIPPYR